MASETIVFHGQPYRLGTVEPCPLPDWLPTVLPAGWQAIDTTPWTGRPDPTYARAYVKNGTLRVLLSCARYGDGHVWLHVSVSRRNQDPPTWDTMSAIKDLFVGPERTAYQVHPPRSQHVNIHPGVLHLWCCVDNDAYLPDFTGGGETI